MNIIDKVKINIKPIISLFLKISAGALSTIGIILSFISFDEIGLSNIGIRIAIFAGIIVVSFLISFISIIGVLKKRKLWGNGKNKVYACYDDIFKISKLRQKKIIVIPVNDTFETIVDDDLTRKKSLVSKNTIHGQWIMRMNSSGIDANNLNEIIQESLLEADPVAEKKLDRGNKKSYPIGTIASVSADDDTVYYLLAISKFDSNNNAHSSRKEIRDSLDCLLDYYDKNGQGYPLYIPLFGTGMSRSKMSHEQSFKLIKSTILTNEKLINGSIIIVVYNNDKDKVSIFK